MWEYALTAMIGVAVGLTAGIVLEKLLTKISLGREIESEKLLKEQFGDPLYINCVSLEDINNWIQGKKDSLSCEGKICVLQAKRELLSKVSPNIKMSSNIDNYVVIAIVSEDKIKDSILIKFDSMDEKLKSTLDKGNGVLIVEA